MCVRIVKGDRQIKYDMDKPLADQLAGSSEVIISYLENDRSVHKFLDEIEKYALTAYAQGLKISVLHNNLVNGVRAKRKALNSAQSMTINELIKLMVLSHRETDKALEEIAAICSGKGCNEQT